MSKNLLNDRSNELLYLDFFSKNLFQKTNLYLYHMIINRHKIKYFFGITYPPSFGLPILIKSDVSIGLKFLVLVFITRCVEDIKSHFFSILSLLGFGPIKTVPRGLMVDAIRSKMS